MEHPQSEFKSKAGLGRVSGAVRNTLDGFRAAWRHEHAFRQEVVVFVAATVGALLLPVSVFQKVLLVCVMLLVLLVELLNSAIEAIVDRISLDRHPLSKNAKDMGSAAVSLAIAIASLTWAVVLFNRFW